MIIFLILWFYGCLATILWAIGCDIRDEVHSDIDLGEVIFMPILLMAFWPVLFLIVLVGELDRRRHNA